MTSFEIIILNLTVFIIFVLNYYIGVWNMIKKRTPADISYFFNIFHPTYHY